MTENKRFVETISTGIVTDTITGKEYKCEMRIDDDLLKLLNRYDEDCKMYREDALKAEKNKEVLLEENEQLKSELKALRKKYNDFSDAVDKRLQEMDKRLLE